jgi:uncharacterized membrane protein
MNEPSEIARNQTGTILVLWTLIVLYAASRVLQIFPGRVPMLAVVALHVVPAALFALIHGAMLYRVRGILTFIALCLVIGNIFENIGVRTGFPYGHYYFTDLMGPKLFVVPIFLGLAYVGMAYLSWTLARLILGVENPLVGSRIVTLPLTAAFIMVAWDLAMDPIWGTVLHAWIWVKGGAYFGVPVSNFLGWYLTVYVIYQLFALYLRRSATSPKRLPPGYWHLVLVFYAVSAAGNLLVAIPRAGPSVVSDPAGVQWKVSNITSACALVSIFLMGAFVVLAWVRLADQNAEGLRSLRTPEGRSGPSHPVTFPVP